MGDDLRELIASKLLIETDGFGQEVKIGSHSIHAAYRIASKSVDVPTPKLANLVGGGKFVARALPGCDSIDDFLERHTGNLTYEIPAKLGICECILDAERASPLRKNPDRSELPTIDPYARHWLSAFLRNIARTCSVDSLADTFSRLKVVNFNYDRCFEWFTFLWLLRVYNLREAEAHKIMANMSVIHPYGSLGIIPNGDGKGIPFGYEPSANELLDISKGILTYSESISEDTRRKMIQSILNDCDRIVFMGFAFHQQNMDLLKLVGTNDTKIVYATNVKMPAPRWETAEHRILESLGVSRTLLTVHKSSESCEDLVSQFGDRWSDRTELR